MKYVLATLALIMLGACDPRVSPARPDHHIGDTIREQERAFNAAVASKNATAAAAFYAPDAQMFNPGDAPARTSDAILAAYQGLLADPNGALTITNADVVIPSSGDYAISQGTFAISFTDPQRHRRVDMTGTYMTLWRHQDDGSWKIMRDIATAGPQSAQPSSGGGGNTAPGTRP